MYVRILVRPAFPVTDYLCGFYPEEDQFPIRESPFPSADRLPVLTQDLHQMLVGVLARGPSPQCVEDVVPECGEGSLRIHVPMIVRPSSQYRVELFDNDRL